MRKGSLQLSINAIVILIMAIALLGVGIFFINNVLGNVLSQPAEISEQLRGQLLQQLRESGTKFLISGIGSEGVEINQGDSKDIFLAVNNKEDAPIKVKFAVTRIKESDTDVEIKENYDDITPYSIKPTESVLAPVRFSAGSSRGEEIWLIKVFFCREETTTACTVGTDIYAEQSVFVTVK